MGVTPALVPRVLSAVIKSKHCFMKSPSSNKHQEGLPSWPQVGQSHKGHQLSSWWLPLLQPGPVITTQEGPAGHMHSVGGGGRLGGSGLTLISYPLYLPLHLSNLSMCARPASTEALLPLPQKPSF